MLQKSFYVLLMGILLAGGAQLRAEPVTQYKGKVFLGISGDRVRLPEDPRYESKFGIELESVPIESTAEQAGLEIGDVVVSFLLVLLGFALLAYFQHHSQLIPDGTSLFAHADLLFPQYVFGMNIFPFNIASL